MNHDFSRVTDATTYTFPAEEEIEKLQTKILGELDRHLTNIEQHFRYQSWYEYRERWKFESENYI